MVISCSTNKENKELAYHHYKIGVTQLTKNNNAQALEQLLIARQLDPTNPLILNHLGLAYYFMQEYEHSIIALKDAISEKTNYSEAHNNIGRVYIDIKDFKQARIHLFKAASDLTYAHKDKVWLNIGLSYFYQNKFKNGQKYFLKSISANRTNCLGYNYYGRSLLELENYEKASKALDQAIYHCRKKGLDEPHYYSAISLFRSGSKAKAMARLQEGRKLFPKGPNKQNIDELINLLRITETK
ncbi:MAG: hypothetical protein HRT44_05455 [Bdellovibrionales bacterium]|nr:hypothetical protein [Bdellovibrionales bacterium]